MICETCLDEHSGTYGSGRFCSSICARTYSSKTGRIDTNLKISQALTGRQLSEDHKAKLKENWKPGGGRKRTPLEEMLVKNSSFSGQDIKNRLISEGIKEYKCEICGIDEWNGKELVLQLHHINGIRKDQRLNNLQLLCPNCHSQTENWSGKNRGVSALVSLMATNH